MEAQLLDFFNVFWGRETPEGAAEGMLSYISPEYK